jgi:hypothetical protein
LPFFDVLVFVLHEPWIVRYATPPVVGTTQSKFQIKSRSMSEMGGLRRPGRPRGSRLCLQERTSETWPVRSEKCHNRSFDDLVCADEQGRRNGETERLRCLHVDQKFELGWLLNRQIGRLGAFENFIDVAACTAEEIG